MSTDHRNYYRARAEQELTAASVASDATSAAVHADLARLYLEGAEQSIEDDDLTSLEPESAAGFDGDEGNFRQIQRFGQA